MIFNDITEKFNNIEEILNELTPFYDAAVKINNFSDTIALNSIYYTYSKPNTNNYNPLLTLVKDAVLDTQSLTFNQRTSKLGRILSNLERHGVENIQSNIIKKLIESIESFDDCLFKFNNCKDDSFGNIFANLNKSASKLINTLDLSKEMIKELNHFEVLLMGSPENLNDDEVFSIRLYNENLSIQDINSSIKLFSEIYERSCTILDVSFTEYPLQPLKLETGSLFEKVAGNEKVFGFMNDLFDRLISYLHRNFTKEGKLTGVGNKISVLKEELELIDLCEKHGVNTVAAKEIVEGNLNVLCNDVLKLTTSSTKIAVNGKVFDLSEAISKKILSENTSSLIAATVAEEENI